jgi:arylsulfatase A-like enzyme
VGAAAPPAEAPAARAGRDCVATHSESHLPHHLLATWGLRDARWKFVYTPGDPPELYDLTDDPGERHNLASEQPARAGAMRQRLATLVGFDLDVGPAGGPGSGAAPADISPELDEQLRALGYVR